MGHMPFLATIFNPANAMWSVGIASGCREGDGWDGHLVAAGTRWMLDATVGQMSRLEHNLELGSYVVLDREELERKGRVVYVNGASGSVAIYRTLEDGGYVVTQNWQERTRRKDIIEKLVKGIYEGRKEVYKAG